MTEFIGLASFAEVPAVLVNVQRGGPSTGMPTRTQQSDLLSCAYASNGDTKHVLLFPEDPKECFDFTADALDLADRLQTPVFVMTDLDIGMNHRLCEPFKWDDKRQLDRGKVMTARTSRPARTSAAISTSTATASPIAPIPARTRPRAAYFTRGTTKDEYARYSEEGAVYVRNMERLQKKFLTAAKIAPQPLRYSSPKPTKLRRDLFGSTSPAMAEALIISSRPATTSMRCACGRSRSRPGRGLHPRARQVFVVEQNRDGQLRTMLMVRLHARRAQARSRAAL